MSKDPDISTADRPPTTSFSTDQFAPADRFEAWRSQIALTHDIDGDPQGFEARSTSTTLDRMVVRSVTCSPLSVERSARRVRANGLDHVLLRLAAEPWDFEVDGRCVQVPAGSVAVNSYTRPIRRSQCADRGSVLLHLSRDLVAEALPNPEDFHGHVISGPLGTLLGSHVATLARHVAEISAESGADVARATAQLLAATLAPSRRTAGEALGALRAARLTQCKRYIDHHLCSPELSVDTICRDVGVSRSTLYRLFDAGGGVAAYIRRRRLDAARTALSAPVVPRISDVARDFGFPDIAAFSRAFKAEFGRSPRDLAHTRRPRTDVMGKDVFKEWIRAMRA